MKRPQWQAEGKDPDYRFSLANERTFLAWIRTGLAILAGAILLHQVGLSAPPWVIDALSGTLSLLGGALGGGAYLRWRDNEISMRYSRSLPASFLIPLLTVGLLLLGTASYAFLVIR